MRGPIPDNRKIIQFQTHILSAHPKLKTVIHALCDDGTIWEKYINPNSVDDSILEWKRIDVEESSS